MAEEAYSMMSTGATHDVTENRRRVKERLEEVLELPVAKRKEGIFGIEDYQKHFTLDGGVRLKQIHRAYRDFFTADYPDRVSRQKNGDYTLRGLRYLCALDFNLTLTQQLQALKNDGIAALSALRKDTLLPQSPEHFLTRFAVLDYVKNTAMTFLNGILTPEKFGDFRTSDPVFVSLRKNASEFAELAVRAQYSHMLGRYDESRHYIELLEHKKKILDALVTELELIPARLSKLPKGKNKSPLTRPELAHPLIIAAGALYCVEKTKREPPDTIIIMPTGGTEYGFAVRYAYEALIGHTTKRVLLPLSLHSTRASIDSDEDLLTSAALISGTSAENSIKKFLGGYRDILAGQHVLITDDNTASGRTIELTRQLLKINFGPKTISSSVAEYDAQRIEGLLEEANEIGKEVPIATDRAIAHTIAELPLSRVQAGLSLRNRREARRVIESLKESMSSVVANGIMRKALSRGLTRSLLSYIEIKQRAGEQGKRDNIYSFRETFLSNFAKVDVQMRVPQEKKGNGRAPLEQFPSVEHAYQAAKFPDALLKRIPREVYGKINAIMQERALRSAREWRPLQEWNEVKALFRDDEVSAGTVKVIADIIRDSGHIREDWSARRLPVMLDLLIQKFTTRAYAEQLLATGDKILVEGVTWPDPIFGVVVPKGTKVIGYNQIKNGVGYNFLGYFLMEIRDALRDGRLQIRES